MELARRGAPVRYAGDFLVAVDHAAGRRFSDPIVLRFPTLEICRIGAV
jgi:hypothetical protein